MTTTMMRRMRTGRILNNLFSQKKRATKTTTLLRLRYLSSPPPPPPGDNDDVDKKCRHHNDHKESWSSGWTFPKPPPPPTQQELYDNGLPILHRAATLHANNIFLSGWQHDDDDGTVDIVTYNDVLIKARFISDTILTYNTTTTTATTTTAKTMSYDDDDDSLQPRNFVAHLNVPGWEYVATQWGAWGAGYGSVPIALSQKVPEIEHVLEQSNPRFIFVGGNCPLHHHHHHHHGNDDQYNGNASNLLSHQPSNTDELFQAADNVGMMDRVISLSDIITTHNNNNRTLGQQQQEEGGTSSSSSSFRLGNGGIVKSLDEPALLLFTSGTTGKPKAAVITHRNIYHQVTDLVTAWEWDGNVDIALHFLPLHHVHGVINLLSCAAFVGAQLQFQPFHALSLWKQWAAAATTDSTNTSDTTATNADHCLSHHSQQKSTTTAKLPKPNILMAVPTIYAKLLEAADKLPQETIEAAVKNTLHPMRLMVSGSAALPVSILERWKELTHGHTLLERYGMTEFAMALSNPYREDKEQQRRRPGYVGRPLPSVKVRLVDPETNVVIETPGVSGELQVTGPTVFREYLNRPDATREAFTEDGYFRTGDIAQYDADDVQSYRILGRASVDIIKNGGNKLSALEIERELLEHPDIAEVVVLGIPDDIWGERVAMIYRLKPDREPFTIDELRIWSSDRLSKEKVPSLLRVVNEIPKNAMGKVNKKNLADLFQ